MSAKKKMIGDIISTRAMAKIDAMGTAKFLSEKETLLLRLDVAIDYIEELINKQTKANKQQTQIEDRQQQQSINGGEK